MYCKQCGEPPLNRTVYCKKCGHKLPDNLETLAMKVLPEKQSGLHLQQNGIFLFAGYVTLLVYLYIDNYPGTGRFWPLSGIGSVSDFSDLELFFFLIIGAILFAIANFYGANRYPRNDEYAQMYDYSYKQDSQLLWFATIMYALQIYYVIVIVPSQSLHYGAKGDNSWLMFFFAIAARIIGAIAAHQEARRLNREATNWAVFAVISPAMALLFLSQKNKLRE